MIAYAERKDAIAVSTNKDFARTARRMRAARAVYLRVTEPNAVAAMERALDWLQASGLPSGRVLRVPLSGAIQVMSPLPW